MLGVLIYLSLLLLAHSSFQQVCKYPPESPFWPRSSEWTKFNETVDGRLLRPDPPAAACHSSFPQYDPKKCAEIRTNWNSSQWHSDNPTSSLWQNWNDYSCLPDNKTSCDTDGYPVYVVNVTRKEHVKLAVDFARTKNIRLNIKSTGHDFLGRSVQPKSLSIWTHYLRDLEFHESSFSPQGCGITIPGAALSVGSGAQMREIYRFAANRNVMIVGGASNTVSAGGYFSGGGHSSLSPMYGMGADNVIEIEAITANGDIVIANECTNADLFWAMRGGGGSTFGVVTRFTLHAIPAVSIASWYGWIMGNVSSDANWDAVTYIHEQWPKRLAGASGYMIGIPSILASNWTQAPSLSINLPNVASNLTLPALLNPILDEMKNRTGGKVYAWGQYYYYKSWADSVARNSTGDDSKGFPGAGATKLIASWLWDEIAMESPNLKRALMASSDNQTLLYNDFTAGPGTHNPPFMRGGGNAVNPAWRRAIVRPAAEMDWTGVDLAKLEERKETLKTFQRAMASLAPYMGNYGNEANAYDTNAKRNNFGSNYPRLLRIKSKYDPTGVFWCSTCVGNEMFVERDGILCLRNRKT